MESTGHVNVEINDGVGRLSFYHPKKNSLPGVLLKEIADAVTETAHRSDVRIMILTSEGEGPFCAGASFDELIAIDSFERGKAFFMGFARLILAIKEAPCLIIGRIQGKAVGGGVGVAAACDYALATEQSAVKLSELAIGIGPFVVGPAVERKIGTGPFSAMASDADWRSAEWALRHGLYVNIFPDIASLDQEVERRAQRFANFNPEAMTALKTACWSGTGHWKELLEERAEYSGRLVLSEFTRKAIEAFKAK